ncbi:MAG: c-type cytochrome [Acidobacteria bacterium]|uniref:C-type cytochrome n=1 Tax=Candidatus Polarisedimenticola svalbardensis TaxID=2886004 RepID=A0A8J6XVR7_9BACT|nr:c-type cytochrome [Candidatus Polarisedimenticola svalbardensis]
MLNEKESSNRLWRWFGVSSVLFLVVMAISPLKDYFREYRDYQKAYADLLLDRAGSRKEVEEAKALAVEIRQIWIPDWNNRVDRCITCHQGVDRQGMEDVAQPFRSHPDTPHSGDDFQAFGCVICHRGQGRATTVADAHGDSEDWDSPLLPAAYVESSCGICHLGKVVPEASMITEGRRLLESSGCFGCHDFPGQRDWIGTAPRLDGLAEKTTPRWVRAWLRRPADWSAEAAMPDFRLADDEIDALVAFLWSRPPLNGPGVTGIGESSQGDYDRGRKIFRESRCISCHTVDGKGNGSAPELEKIGSKVSRGWLMAYLSDPHAFQPETAMPQFQFTGNDVLDLSAYMMEEFIEFGAEAQDDAYKPDPRAAEEGQKLFVNRGCSGCHAVQGVEQGMRIGPALTGIGGKPAGMLDFGKRDDLPRTLPDWLRAKIAEPDSFRPDLKMPRFEFDDKDFEAVVTALLAVSDEEIPPALLIRAEPPGEPPAGRFGRLVSRYRCLACHQVNGAGGDISTAPLTAEGSKVRREWLEQYLMLPTTIRPLLTDRMIHLRIPQEEASFMADYMENVYVDDAIPELLFPDGVPPESVERGRKLFYERYGCQSCHMIDNQGGYYGPILNGLGARLKPGWTFWWLQGPQRWRADVRCPDQGIPTEDATDLAGFIEAVSNPGMEDAP